MTAESRRDFQGIVQCEESEERFHASCANLSEKELLE